MGERNCVFLSLERIKLCQKVFHQSPEQFMTKLREIEVKIGQGKDVLTACREAGDSVFVTFLPLMRHGHMFIGRFRHHAG
jgi:hypothetical protein